MQYVLCMLLSLLAPHEICVVTEVSACVTSQTCARQFLCEFFCTDIKWWMQCICDSIAIPTLLTRYAEHNFGYFPRSMFNGSSANDALTYGGGGRGFLVPGAFTLEGFEFNSTWDTCRLRRFYAYFLTVICHFTADVRRLRFGYFD